MPSLLKAGLTRGRTSSDPYGGRELKFLIDDVARRFRADAVPLGRGLKKRTEFTVVPDRLNEEIGREGEIYLPFIARERAALGHARQTHHLRRGAAKSDAPGARTYHPFQADESA